MNPYSTTSSILADAWARGHVDAPQGIHRLPRRNRGLDLEVLAYLQGWTAAGYEKNAVNQTVFESEYGAQYLADCGNRNDRNWDFRVERLDEDQWTVAVYDEDNAFVAYL